VHYLQQKNDILSKKAYEIAKFLTGQVSIYFDRPTDCTILFSTIFPLNGHFFIVDAEDGILSYKPCTKNLIDLHSAYTIFCKDPTDTLSTVEQAAKEICSSWNDSYSRVGKVSNKM